MQSYISILFLIVATTTVINASIGGDSASTLKIFTKLCLSAKNEPSVPRKYFECYETVDDEARRAYLTCQWDVYGFYFDTKSNLSNACPLPLKYLRYSRCLEKEFTAIGQKLEVAAAIVNVCQANVVGVN